MTDTSPTQHANETGTNRSRWAVIFRRLFNIAAALSMAFACLCVISFPLSSYVNPKTHYVSLGSEFHVSIDARPSNFLTARLFVYNNASNGPWTGGTLSLAGDPNPPIVTGFGDTALIYYCHIRFVWPEPSTLWTLAVSMVYPLLLSLILPVTWLVSHKRRSRRLRHEHSQQVDDTREPAHNNNGKSDS